MTDRDELLEKIGRRLRNGIPDPPLTLLREEFLRHRRQGSRESAGEESWWIARWPEIVAAPIRCVVPMHAASGAAAFWKSTEVFIDPGAGRVDDARHSLLILGEPRCEERAPGETCLAFLARLPETQLDESGESDLRPVEPGRYEILAVDGERRLGSWTIHSEEQFGIRIPLSTAQASDVDPHTPGSWPFLFVLRRL